MVPPDGSSILIWKKAARAYGLDAASLIEEIAEHNPVDRLEPIAKVEVPILHIHGDKDKVVPLEENSGLLHERYKALGGLMQLVVIPRGRHDIKKHWFENQQLVDFVIKHAHFD